MRFRPYGDAGNLPNVIVDGAATTNTLLTLSHWPHSPTPTALMADTSAEIVFRYLDAPAFHVPADVVSNNHFDEDGLIGVFTMVEPVLAQRHRDLLIDTAQAGDFGVFKARDAARIVFTISACADAEMSPLPKAIFARPYPELASELYERLLELLPRLLTNLDDYQELWEAEDARLAAGETLVEKKVVTIEERPELDLAIVRIPEDLSAQRVHRFTQGQLRTVHPFALHNATRCSRLLLLQGKSVELQYRYEGWVQLTSRKVAPRVDLAPLAKELNKRERSKGRWVFDGVDRITPGLHLEGSDATSIPPETIVERVEESLRTGPPAWNPYSA